MSDPPFVPPVVRSRSARGEGLGYDPLQDPNLTGYLRSKPVFRHLRKCTWHTFPFLSFSSLFFF